MNSDKLGQREINDTVSKLVDWFFNPLSSWNVQDIQLVHIFQSIV